MLCWLLVYGKVVQFYVFVFFLFFSIIYQFLKALQGLPGSLRVKPILLCAFLHHKIIGNLPFPHVSPGTLACLAVVRMYRNVSPQMPCPGFLVIPSPFSLLHVHATFASDHLA